MTKLREKMEAAHERVEVCNELAADRANEQATEAARSEIESLEHKIARLQLLIDRKEEKISK